MRFVFVCFVVFLLAVGACVAQDSGVTPPAGLVATRIAAGTGSVRTATFFSVPLVVSPEEAGRTVGLVSAVAAQQVSDSQAKWRQLVFAGQPLFVRFTTGVAVGRTFQVVSNTSSALTIFSDDGVSETAIDLVALGVKVGDAYMLLRGESLISLFGNNATLEGVGVPQGASTAAAADWIELTAHSIAQTYYFNTAKRAWCAVADDSVADSVVIAPDSGIIYRRRAASALVFVAVGAVPTVERQCVVRAGGTTALAHHWPVDIALKELNLQSIPGWMVNSNPSLADTVQARLGGSSFSFYYTGTAWRDVASGAMADEKQIPAGSSILVRRRATDTTASIFRQILPYSL